MSYKDPMSLGRLEPVCLSTGRCQLKEQQREKRRESDGMLTLHEIVFEEELMVVSEFRGSVVISLCVSLILLLVSATCNSKS